MTGATLQTHGFVPGGKQIGVARVLEESRRSYDPNAMRMFRAAKIKKTC
jgi:hypothetical protein